MTLYRMPLRNSIPLVLVVLALTFQIVVSWVGYAQTSRKSTAIAQDRLRLLAVLISAETESQFRVGNEAVVGDVVSHAISDRDVRAAYLVDAEDRILLGRPVDLEGRGLDSTRYASVAPLAAECRERLVGDVFALPGRGSLVAVYPVLAPKSPVDLFPSETIVLVIEYDLERLQNEALREAGMQFALHGGAALAISVLLWLFLRKTVLERFQRLLDAVQRLGRGDFAVRVGMAGRDEFAELGAGFDAMASRLETGEERMDRQDRWFRELIEHSSDVLLVLGPDRRILFASTATEIALGLPSEALIGRPLTDFANEDDRARLDAVLDLDRTEGNAEDAMREQVRFVRPDGGQRTIELASARATTPLGEPALIVNGRDVTDRQRLEAELAQSRKLQAVGNLAAGVAHDFNNLLTTIRGYSELLELRLGGVPELRRMTGAIQQAVDRGAALTQQMLLFGRKDEAHLQPLDLNEVIRGLDQLARAAVGMNELREDFARPLAPILGDPGRIEQILLNLLQNARDSIEGEGTIRIETRNLDAGGHETRDVSEAAAVQLRVRDSGCGMDAETSERLFEPYFTTKGPHEGTGLGLSVVYGAVTEHGGEIQVDSAPGEGTTFTITWPTTSAAPEKHVRDRAAPAPRGSGEHVLVVDDEPQVRGYVSDLLKSHGYRVDIAADAESALTYLRSATVPPDLILTDVVMPGIGGVDFVRQLQAEGSTVPVLLMTGYTERRPSLESVVEFPTGLLAKPFTSIRLLRAVWELLVRKRASVDA